MSLSAHKVYGPKGVGALFVRRDPRAQLAAQMHGGGHERGLRSGTLPTHQLVGMGQAFRLAKTQLPEESVRLHGLRDQLMAGLSQVSDCQLHVQATGGVPGIVNLGFAGVDGESLLLALRQIAVSSGSACMSATLEPSYVLKAMGVDDDMAQSALRISFGRFSTTQDIDTALESLVRTLEHLRPLARAQA